MVLKVSILYTPPGGRPLRLVNVHDRRLLLAVAAAAIAEADVRANGLAEADPVLGEIEAAEAGRLRRVLSTLIPEMAPECEMVSVN